jgi:hypothetical protein
MTKMTVDHILLNQFDTIIDHILSCGAHDVMIAGGAVRDMLLKRPIKDIDVFYTGKLDDNKVNKIFKAASKPPKPTDPDELEDYYEKQESWEVYGTEWTLEGFDYPIQFVHVKKEPKGGLTAHIHTFGCNISKVLYNNHLSMSDKFLNDVWLEQLTFTEELQRGAYKKRMIDKFPTYSVVDPTETSINELSLNF